MDTSDGHSGTASPFRVSNRNGASRYVFVCDHASNHIPPRFGTLGLSAPDLMRHIAWDPGALPVASGVAAALDATLVECCVSRLVIDCNRPLDAPDLISEIAEATPVPGNAGLSSEQREERMALVYRPYHAALRAIITERIASGREPWLVAIHSFTPVFQGVRRSWQAGVIHDDDERLARPLIAALRALGGVTVGDNEPYAPRDRVYHTLETHARSRGLPCVMIEIRNDEIATVEGQCLWVDRLAGILGGMGFATLQTAAGA